MARAKGVNQDQDNPLRLLAVSQGGVHYFTDDPCVRGHVGNHYAKTGRCVACVNEDRLTFMRSPAGKIAQRRKDDLRALRTLGRTRRPSRLWHTRLALYEQLVEAGLPVDPSVPLGKRVHVAWAAYQDLTSDATPDNVRTRKAMRRAIREARRQDKINAAKQKDQARAEHRAQRQAEREADAIEREPMRARRREIAAFVRQGSAMGIPITTMRARVYQSGWTWQRACSTPVEQSFRPNGLAADAQAAGLSVSLVTARIHTLGWSREKALTTPVGTVPHNKGVMAPDSLASQAIAAGITPSAYYNRVSKGWSHERAISTPMNFHFVPVEEQKRRAKVRRDARRAALTPVLLCDNGVNREKDKGLTMSKDRRPTTHVGMFMGARGRPPNLRRNEARDAGLRTYDDSDHPCWCGSETKYTKNAACVACLIEKGKARYAGLEGLALEKRKREDHARYVARVSKT